MTQTEEDPMEADRRDKAMTEMAVTEVREALDHLARCQPDLKDRLKVILRKEVIRKDHLTLLLQAQAGHQAEVMVVAVAADHQVAVAAVAQEETKLICI